MRYETNRVGSDQVSGCLISDHLRFRVVRVWIRSDFGSFDFESSQVSGRLGSDRVGFEIVWSRVIPGFQVVRVWIGSSFGLSDLRSSRVVRVRIGSGSDQFDLPPLITWQVMMQWSYVSDNSSCYWSTLC